MFLNTVRLKIVKSEDSVYHIRLVKLSLGNTPAIAENNAASISFPITQKDSVVYFPKGFPVSSANKFRNQQVIAIVEVPVGKKIMIDGSLDRYDWFDINFNRRRGWNIDWNDRWNNSYSWDDNVLYIMKDSGLERADKAADSEEKVKLKKGKFTMKANDSGVEIKAEGELENDKGNDKGTYRYHQRDGKEKTKTDTTPLPPPAPKQPDAPVPPADRKISAGEDGNKTNKEVTRAEKEERHTSFLFLTMGR
jgi:hypothetical protein